MQLIITEKPSVATAIAKALNIRDEEKHTGYIEGGDRIVSWCLGHLVELAEPEDYDKSLKHWSYDTLPILPEEWKYKVKPDSREQFHVLKSLIEDPRVTELVEATDAGREGEAIFRLVCEQAGCDKPVKRLWISSMETQAIREGFENLKPAQDYDNLYRSARCRQEADWLVGINGTRLFTVLYGKTLKVGRVQTPTLAMLVDREAEISGFKKKPYFIAHIEAKGIDAASEKIDEKAKAEEAMRSCEGSEATVLSVKKEEKTELPPKLYDLTALQRDANRLFCFTAKQTLDYAQSLYEKKLITYPRTDSRYLTEDMETTAREVLELSASIFPFLGKRDENPDISRILDSSKVTDHHALIPTKEIGQAALEELPEGEKKILSLIAARIASATAGKHSYTTIKAVLNCNGQEFTATGKTITENGWKSIEEAFRNHYDMKKDEAEKPGLPDLKEGQVLQGIHSKVTEHSTQPPKRYTEDTLLRSMENAGSAETAEDAERKGLGTPATRADIIEKLVKDGYVKRDKKQMIPTEDGIRLITVMPEAVKSPKLTSEWENSLAKVAKGEASAEDFMEGIRDMVEKLVSTYHAVSDDKKALFGSSDRKTLGRCPKCGGDVLFGKYGFYCVRKCGMKLGRAMGKELEEEQVKDLLAGKKILLTGIRNSKGSTFDAYLTPRAISDFHYTDKDGKEVSGFQYDFEMTYPKKG